MLKKKQPFINYMQKNKEAIDELMKEEPDNGDLIKIITYAAITNLSNIGQFFKKEEEFKDFLSSVFEDILESHNSMGSIIENIKNQQTKH